MPAALGDVYCRGESAQDPERRRAPAAGRLATGTPLRPDRPTARTKVLMKLRKPRITATIWSSGKVICTGATSEEEAKLGARRLARSLQKLGFQVIFTDFKVVNVLAVCNMPFEIRLPEFTKNNRPHASYEPELHPAVCYRIKTLRATLQIFSTGSITVTGPNIKAVASAVEQIYPFVFESRK
ncbi:TATA box-binding protein-like 1 isoform 2-T4 [Chlamydotis macqueenii]